MDTKIHIVRLAWTHRSMNSLWDAKIHTTHWGHKDPPYVASPEPSYLTDPWLLHRGGGNSQNTLSAHKGNNAKKEAKMSPIHQGAARTKKNKKKREREREENVVCA